MNDKDEISKYRTFFQTAAGVICATLGIVFILIGIFGSKITEFFLGLVLLLFTISLFKE